MVPPLRSGGNPQAVLAVLSGHHQGSAPSAHTQPARPNHLLALAIAAAVLGTLCGGATLLVRKGPQPPAPVTEDREDGLETRG